MSIVSTAGLTVYLTGAVNDSANNQVSTTITAVTIQTSMQSNTKLTVSSTTGLVVGQAMYVQNTGFSELDGYGYIIGAVDATAKTVEILGATTFGSTNVLNSLAGFTPTLFAFKSNLMVPLSLSTIQMTKDATPSISVATFDSPTATIVGTNTSAGTGTLTGFVDVSSASYDAIYDAEADALKRFLVVKLPKDGWIVVPLVISTVTWELPLSGAMGFTATATLTLKPKHCFA